MKKTIRYVRRLVIFLIITLVLAESSALAADEKSTYSGSGYSIDIPSKYSQIADNVWSKGKTTTLNIEITENSNRVSVTDETMDNLVNKLQAEGSWSIEEYEIALLPGKKYRCVYVKGSNLGIHEMQYYIPSRDYIYTITCIAQNEDYLYSNELNEIIKSFTIANYKSPKSTVSPVLVGGLVVIAIIGAGITVYVIIKSRKLKENMR